MLLIDNIIVPVTAFLIFNSIAELGAAKNTLQIYLTEVSNWQAVTKKFIRSGIIIEHGTILGSLRYS